MAKPKQKERIVHQPISSSTNFISGNEKFFLPVVLLITFIVLFPSLQNKFINLDDPQYVTENPVIKNISIKNIKIIFSEQFVGNYQPLTMLSYMIDYKFFGLNPFGYHLMNLIFHLLNTLLVFLIVSKLIPLPAGRGKGWAAFITSLLFGIHPLHVESVAWISERKDVLYGFFFLWALYLYIPSPTTSLPISEGESKTSPHQWKVPMAIGIRGGFCLLLFALAILSKAQAVVLPVIFFCVDFLIRRPFTKKLFMEKIPFFILAFMFGWIAIKVQSSAGAVQTFQYFPFYERILFSCYALLTYLHKIILPINLSCFYPYPETDDKINTIWVYISPAVLLVLAFIIWKYLRKEKAVLFGTFFFLITIVLVLQLIPVGDALYADRYTYIPSIGLFFIAVHYFSIPTQSVGTNFGKAKLLTAATAAYLLFLCYLSFHRTKKWHDSIALYTDAIHKNYKAAIIYNNRGAVLSDSGRNEEALKDFTSLVELKPRYPNGWRNKGLVHERLGQKAEALVAFSQAIKYFPDDTKNYLSRGTLSVQKNDFENALEDFTKIIELQPGSGEGYYARAEVLGKSGKLQEALADINKAIKLSPDNAQAYNNRGIIFSMGGRYEEAVNDFTKSLQLNPDNIGAYTNRSLAYKGMGKYAAALQDMLSAKEKGIAISEREIEELKKLTENKNQ